MKQPGYESKKNMYESELSSELSNKINQSAIYAAIESLLEYGGRAMIFSCSSNKLGYGVSSLNNDNLNVGINILKTTNVVEKKNRPEEEKKLLNSENEYKLFSEQNKDFYYIFL